MNNKQRMFTEKLHKITDRIFYMVHQPEVDRPMLVYIRGEKYALAVDAGYSAHHVEDFYGLLEQEGLSLPDFTVITHWHYDHTYGMHRTAGCCIAHEKTNEFLREEMRKSLEPGYVDFMKKEDLHFAKEYEGLDEVTIVPAQLEFANKLQLDLGGLTAEIFHTTAPHSEDSVCIYIPEEKVLFLGDSICPDFFNSCYLDKEKLAALIKMIEEKDCRYCILSHEEPLTKEDLLEYLYGELKK